MADRIVQLTSKNGDKVFPIAAFNTSKLPIASETSLGTIKVGNNLSISDDGTLSANAQAVKLYSGIGSATDGAMTQKAVTDELNKKATTEAVSSTQKNVESEAATREAEDIKLQEQIDSIVASADVRDVVGTKADLDKYNTESLGNNDIIKVLKDESQSGATTYYRWNGTSFVLIGSEGPYYTKGETDTLLNAKASTASVTEAKNAAQDAQQKADSAYDIAESAQSDAIIAGNNAQDALSKANSAQQTADKKATITLTTTDPGTGATLAANNFIAVYEG